MGLLSFFRRGKKQQEEKNDVPFEEKAEQVRLFLNECEVTYWQGKKDHIKLRSGKGRYFSSPFASLRIFWKRGLFEHDLIRFEAIEEDSNEKEDMGGEVQKAYVVLKLSDEIQGTLIFIDPVIETEDMTRTFVLGEAETRGPVPGPSDYTTIN